jgi:predicted transcriptional regulator
MDTGARSRSRTALAMQREAFGSAMRRVIGEILAQRNRSLAAEVLSLVTGVAYLGASEAKIAKRFGITRAAVSKRAVELCERLGVQPSRAMKQKWEDFMNEETAASIAADLARIDNAAAM